MIFRYMLIKKNYVIHQLNLLCTVLCENEFKNQTVFFVSLQIMGIIKGGGVNILSMMIMLIIMMIIMIIIMTTKITIITIITMMSCLTRSSSVHILFSPRAL